MRSSVKDIPGNLPRRLFNVEDDEIDNRCLAFTVDTQDDAAPRTDCFWIEWRRLYRDSDNEITKSANGFVAVSRISGLQHIAELHGWVDDTEHGDGEDRIGFVFKPPNGSLLIDPPTNLYQLLNDESTAKVPLEDHQALAMAISDALLILHSKNQYHGDFRSANIVFHPEINSRIIYQNFFISGTELWRPDAEAFEASLERTYEDPHVGDHMYRHPNDQPSRKVLPEYDIYGLGVVIFELAFGKTVYDILGVIDPLKRFSLTFTRKVRGKLLEKLLELEGVIGREGASFVRLCLTGPESKEENQAAQSTRFGEAVAEKLGEWKAAEGDVIS